MQLTTGNVTSDGLLQILYQGEWYTTCRPNNYYYNSYYYYYYPYPYNNHANIVCRELGYDGGVVAFGRRRRLTEYMHQLWYYDLYCEGTEDSIYDCIHLNDILSRYYCSYLAEYSCQSKLFTITVHVNLQVGYCMLGNFQDTCSMNQKWEHFIVVLQTV